jgi:hypothetical protein
MISALFGGVKITWDEVVDKVERGGGHQEGKYKIA